MLQRGGYIANDDDKYRCVEEENEQSAVPGRVGSLSGVVRNQALINFDGDNVSSGLIRSTDHFAARRLGFMVNETGRKRSSPIDWKVSERGRS
jgi:hypothetical protein